MIKHDIVVIGGGLAGMRAAVEAAERGADVAIVSKLHPVRSLGAAGRFCVIEDPAGAVCALYETAKT